MRKTIVYRKIFLLMLLCGALKGEAQIVNTGQNIFIDNQGLFFVETTYDHSGGSILDNGTFQINGNITNKDANSTVFIPASTGTVNLSGNTQIIGGTNKITFPNLSLLGSGSVTLGFNADVLGTLALNTKEFKANEFNLTITNPLFSSITRTSGFISTDKVSNDKEGKLIRSTNSTSPYLFPVGSASLYRPLEFVPLDVLPSSFGVTFTNADPNGKKYNRESKRNDIQKVFDKYYYIINQESGSANTNVRFYQSALEAEYKQLVAWSVFNLWEKASPSIATEGNFNEGLVRYLTYTSTGAIRNTPFTYATSSSNDSPLTFFNAFSPDGDNINETWVINNIDLFPSNTLTIFNRWGDEVFKAKPYTSGKAWDGGNLTSGTYFYVLNVDIYGTQKTYKGFINMVKKN